MNDYSFMTKVTAFFMCYLKIPKNFYESGGEVLSKKCVQKCAKYLIDTCVFDNAKDMKIEAGKEFNIILTQWIFEYEQE